MTSKQKGFTLTELMLSMAFVSFLLLFLMAGIIHVMRIYNKGLSIRQINQSGRQVSEDFVRTAKYATAGTARYDSVNQRVCVNGITYAWNLNDPTAGGATIKNSFTGAPAGTSPITMVRVTDSGGTLCGLAAANVIPYAQASRMLPIGLNVKKAELTSADSGKIVMLSTVLSTGGANAPAGGKPTPTGFECDPGPLGAFCAFADFNALVYMRN